ncbi:MAG: aminopeptidase P family protein [Clostridia bacterium]|nr:aminopeptidase P family protein [Clostridia bacterium]
MVGKLKDLLGKMDGVFLTSPHSLRYFTGFSGGEGVALIGKTEKFLFVDSRYTEAAKNEAKNFTVIEFGSGTRTKEIGRRMTDLNIKRLGYEEAELTVADYHGFQKGLPDAEWVGCSRELTGLRMVKTEEELQALRTAEQIGVDAFLAVLPQIRVGMTENELAAELEYQMRKRGSEGTSFETIAISGKKTSMPHGRPDDKKLEPGDFVTMDFGCRYRGYCSDMTRTVVLGKASEEQKKIYETVKHAQGAGLSAIRAGVMGKEADGMARAVIADAGYGNYFGHSLGHGVGLQIHELPNLSPMSETVLQPGMVVTCEPGIYIPDLGGVRIEDMVCVTQNGYENLTLLSKELLEL